MKVILLQRVKGLGDPGTVVEVAAGHASNFLIPRGLAEEATSDHLARRAAQLAKQARQTARDRQQAEEAAARISGQQVIIPAKAGESGRLFGSVTPADVAEAVSRQLGVALDRRRIDMSEPFKSLGVHTVTVRLHADISAAVLVRIEPV